MVMTVTAEQVRLLLISPDLDSALSLRENLTSAGGGAFVFYRAERAKEALVRVAKDEYDILIVDAASTDMSNLLPISDLRKAAPRIPILVVSDRADMDAGMAAIRAGAQDYVVNNGADSGAIYRSVQFALARTPGYADASVHRSQQNEVQNQFLSHISHELRSPITAIFQFVTILLDGLAGELTQEQREYLEITLRNINQMRDMVRDLMDVTRAQTGKLTIRPRCMSPISLIAETVISLQTPANARGIKLAPLDMNYVPPVLADPGRIQQILNNLCDNALKFCAAGDTITLTARPFEADDSYVCISVADTGCGISKEGSRQVFEYLYQDQTGINYNRKGLGIGLAICRELVNQHGGHIWVDSEPGKGSLFSFVLPRFTMLNMMTPLLEKNAGRAVSVQLVTIEVCSGPSAKVHTGESTRQRIWDAIERGIRTGHETVLPRMSSRPETELIFVVAVDSNSIDLQQMWTRILRDARLDSSLIEVRLSSQNIVDLADADFTDSASGMSEICNSIQLAIETRING